MFNLLYSFVQKNRKEREMFIFSHYIASFTLQDLSRLEFIWELVEKLPINLMKKRTPYDIIYIVKESQ